MSLAQKVLMLIVLFWALMFDQFAHAAPTQGFLTPITAHNEPKHKDTFGRDTPRSAVQGFMQAIGDGDVVLATHYLDGRYLSSMKQDDAKKIVGRFKKALDAGGRLDADLQISGDSLGNLSDNLPADLDKVGEIHLMNAHIDILMVRHESADGAVYWQFAKQTLANLPHITKSTPTLAENMGLDKLNHHRIFGVNVGDIMALALLVVGAYVVIYVLVWLMYWLAKMIYQGLMGGKYRITPTVIMPLAIIIVAMLLPQIMLPMGVPVNLRTSFGRFKDVIAWGATAWLVLRLIDALFGRAEALSIKHNHPEQVSILSLLRKIAKALMLILAVIIILGNLGFDLTTGMAALGVSGLALAFGAQKTIENLIGSVVVVADRPVRVGDYCRFGNLEGTVIDIGIRSSRIRTLNRTVVTVPNGEFSSMQIENYAKRDMFHFLHQLYIARDADADELGRMIRELQMFISSHDYVNNEWTQVHIIEMRQDCFVVQIRCYIDALGVIEFYGKQSELILDILNQLKNYQVSHALPTQTVHVQSD
ncbi:mechanosensitive ion channel family protein [Moraxella sp. Tifton1]|uniref:mechanosensitive ion channel family protein n=1 Tax=Moraxella oculi TaxID=2940516 RepID=UPI0020110AB0|nr:mechanosensitive ion channel family protein [Moraxella sp. Tifton1]MCL1623559.1 mechanosensitive ion channel family protein [Moraxella sp. Tifton1]